MRAFPPADNANKSTAQAAKTFLQFLHCMLTTLRKQLLCLQALLAITNCFSHIGRTHEKIRNSKFNAESNCT